jgi:hypothetical protein
MKSILTTLIALVSLTASAALTNVTSKLTNPDFAARYAGWFNQESNKGVTGGFVHQTNDAFAGKHAEVYMEKWVAQGSRIPNCTMYQHLKGLTPGTYTLVCNAFCGNGSGGNYTASTGGYLYAQDQQTPISGNPGEHRVVFTVGDDGRATIGIKSQNAACNWMAFDYFRLFYNTEINNDSLTARQQIVDAERQQRQTAQDAERATNKVTTYPYVAAGITIALVRASFTGTGIKERGVCWSKETKEPTILDECTTEYFSNSGYLFRLEGLSSATGYWARPYVITTDGKVAYGEAIRFFTERKGNTTYTYDYQAQVENPDQISWDYNINSGMAETVWMYNQLSYLSGFALSVHYVRGAGAGGGTADCSYGGWMRVSQSTSYQQTGTMLHETNHGVGVGTTSEWSNNSNLRENTSSGKWLGPRATKMVRLLENNDGAYMQGDGTHMWAGTTSGSLTYGYGINGAHEDSYSPSNQLLYFGNILITHALHQDGLLATRSSGITAAYTFTHDDDEIYYLKAESDKYGFDDRFVGCDVYVNARGKKIVTFGNNRVAFADIADDPYYQWKLTFDPARAMYAFKNVGSGTYLYNAQAVTKLQNTTPSVDNYFMLLPARTDTKVGDFSATSYWMVRGNAYDSYGIVLPASAAEIGSVSGEVFNPNNEGGEAQRLFILNSAQAAAAQTAARDLKMTRLNEVIAGCEALLTVPVHETAGARSDLETSLSLVKEAKSTYATPDEVSAAVSELLIAAADFLTACRPSDETHPADLSFMWQNASLASSTDHWTATVKPASGSGVWEYFQKTFDLYQNSEGKVPAGHYRLVARAFQRPGTYQDVYTDYITNHTDNVNATLYTNVGGNVRSARMANLWRDATSTSQGTGSVSVGGKYVPNDMSSANAWFTKGYYVDSLYCTTETRAAMRIGLKGTTGTSYWVCFKGGLQVLFYGDIDEHGVDAVDELPSSSAPGSEGDGKFLDKDGRLFIRKNGLLYNAAGERLN